MQLIRESYCIVDARQVEKKDCIKNFPNYSTKQKIQNYENIDLY